MVVATKGDLPWHWQIVGKLLDIFQQNSYFLRPAKCEFEVSRIECLGLVVDGDKLSINPKKANRLHNWPRTLSTVKEVRSVLGVLGYQQPFIPHYTDIAWPLTALTKKDHLFSWTPECWMALDTLINAVTKGPTLVQPDLTLPFFLQVDASAYAMGAILTQKDTRGKHHAVGFLSKTFVMFWLDFTSHTDTSDCLALFSFLLTLKPMYDMTWRVLYVRYDLATFCCTISILEPHILWYSVLGELRSLST